MLFRQLYPTCWKAVLKAAINQRLIKAERNADSKFGMTWKNEGQLYLKSHRKSIETFPASRQPSITFLVYFSFFGFSNLAKWRTQNFPYSNATKTKRNEEIIKFPIKCLQPKHGK